MLHYMYEYKLAIENENYRKRWAKRPTRLSYNWFKDNNIPILIKKYNFLTKNDEEKRIKTKSGYNFLSQLHIFF